MREIKFRAWNPETNKFEYLDIIHQHTIITTLPIPSMGRWEKLQPFQQFTGFHDKEEKEVWDGDLIMDGSVKYPYVYEVFWSDRFQWSMRIAATKEFMGGLSDTQHIVPEEMKYKIIGNIYENPELIKHPMKQ